MTVSARTTAIPGIRQTLRAAGFGDAGDAARGLWLLTTTASATAVCVTLLFDGDRGPLPTVARLLIAGVACWAACWAWSRFRPRGRFWAVNGPAGVVAAVAALGVVLTLCVIEGRRAERWRTLTDAARRGDAWAVRAALATGTNPGSRPPTGPLSPLKGYESPLCLAARTGSVETAETLLRAGAPVDAADWSGATPLQAAAEAGDAAMVGLLLRASARANDRRGQSPALIAAVYNEDATTVGMLLKHGANPETTVDLGDGTVAPLRDLFPAGGPVADLLTAATTRPAR